MPKRSPVSAEVLARWRLLKDGERNIYDIGRLLLQEFPDQFPKNGPMPMSPRSAYIKCWREAQQPELAAAERSAIDKMPEPQKLAALLQPIIEPYQDTIVISDAHLPFHLENVFADALLFAKAHKLKRASLLGDFLDFTFFSSYDNLTQERLDETWLTCARALEALFDHGVEEVFWCAGNHEHRFERVSGVPVMAMLAHVLDAGLAISSSLGKAIKKRVRTTNMFWLHYTNTPDGIDWRLDHQWNHRRVRGSTASALALETNECHTMTGHEHHYSLQLAQNGRYFAVSCPSMQDPQSAEYMVRRAKVGARQCEGFGWLIDGLPGLWSDRDPEPAKARRLRRGSLL